MKEEHNFEHPIFKCAALVENQADADRAEQICIDNDLPIWDRKDAFDIEDSDDEENYIFFMDYSFYVDCLSDDYLTENNLNPISLTHFETLAKDYNGESYESIDDILSKLKQLNNLLNNK